MDLRPKSGLMEPLSVDLRALPLAGLKAQGEPDGPPAHGALRRPALLPAGPREPPGAAPGAAAGRPGGVRRGALPAKSELEEDPLAAGGPHAGGPRGLCEGAPGEA